MIRPGQSPETVFGENNNLPFAGVGKWLITLLDMKQTTTSEFKYWLRIHGIQLKWLGTGTKNNPIKIKSKKRNK